MTGKYPLEDFHANGFALLSGFYDPERDIEPIRQGARRIIELVARKYGVDAPSSTPDEALGAGFIAIAKANRAWGGEIYDAVKQIPAFMALVANTQNAEIFQRIRPASFPGIAGAGHGIRIDPPGEEKYSAPWHQEFPAQLRSSDGIVFWSPLLDIKPEMGPVEIAVGSHKEGLVAIHEDDEGIGKTGAYALHLDSQDERIARYTRVSPCTAPGDLLLIDFMSLHRSGQNNSNIPRWSMQFRLFNYFDPVGIKLGWSGSFATGLQFSDIVSIIEKAYPA